MFREALFSVSQVVAQGYQLCVAFSMKGFSKAPFQIPPVMAVS